jgi:hypothetical protein
VWSLATLQKFKEPLEPVKIPQNSFWKEETNLASIQINPRTLDVTFFSKTETPVAIQHPRIRSFFKNLSREIPSSVQSTNMLVTVKIT